jgi:hypothetical protein
MAEDRRTKDSWDLNVVVTDEGYEVEYLAETIGISRTQAIALIGKHGIDRPTLVREARRLAK